MPPSLMEQCFAGCLELAPDENEYLLQRVDQPLEVMEDTESGRQFLACDFNRDMDFYRSPWTNKYFPANDEEGLNTPSAALRELEERANGLFQAYTRAYYKTGISSCYFWDMPGAGGASDGTSFAAAWLIKKDVTEDQRFVRLGTWDSIHVIEVKEEGDGKAKYTLTTTVILTFEVANDALGEAKVGGYLNRQTEKRSKFEAFQTGVIQERSHLQNMGKMLEEMENRIRNELDSIYISKTKCVVRVGSFGFGFAGSSRTAALARSLACSLPLPAGPPPPHPPPPPPGTLQRRFASTGHTIWAARSTSRH
jgi:capping protein beta